MFMYTAIAPIPLSSFAGEPSQNIGKSFLKVMLRFAWRERLSSLPALYSAYLRHRPPVVDVDAAAASMVWSYIGELIFNMLILVGSIKMADRIVHEMMGLWEGKALEVKINREIRNYTESMFFGLSMRQCVFTVLAAGVAILLYFVLKPYVGTETVSWMCISGRCPRLLLWDL